MINAARHAMHYATIAAVCLLWLTLDSILR
jgi:hypothetical protein